MCCTSLKKKLPANYKAVSGGSNIIDQKDGLAVDLILVSYLNGVVGDIMKAVLEKGNGGWSNAAYVF